MTGWQRWWRRGARTLAVLSTLSAVAIASTVPGAAGAEEGLDGGEEITLPPTYLDGYGWWSKFQQSPAGGQGVPAPACEDAATPASSSECVVGPPPDGLYVAYDYEAVPNQTVVSGPIGNAPVPASPDGAPEPPKPLGPTAYGAVRFVVPEGAETQLTLKFLSKQSSNPGGVDPSVGVVLGCAVATPGWASIQNGRYDQAPAYDCSSADQADVAGDALVFDFPMSMVQNGFLDVAIVGAGERPFQMALDKPIDASLMITNAAELETVTEDVVIPEDMAFEDPVASYDEALTEIPFEPGLSGNVTYTTDEGLLPSPAAPVGRPNGEVRIATPAGQVRNPIGPDASRGERMMAVSLLLMMGLALWWLGGRPVRRPQLLGSLSSGGEGAVPAGDGSPEDAGEGARGIGRFVRARAGKPPRLF